VAPVPPNRGSPATEPWQAKLEVSDIAAEFGPNGRLYGRIERENKTLSPDFASPRVKETDAKAKAADGTKRRGHVNVDEAFAAFWQAYPRHRAKHAAQKAFAAAIERGVAPEALIAGAKCYALERAEEDPTYTKHPATWLNKGCWTDETAGPPTLDNDGNVVAIASRRRGQKSMTECAAELLRDEGYHAEAEEFLMERGYGRS
jgi:hypothetical protein